MAFLDKINSLTKSLSEKANDAIEISKLNSKLASHRADISIEIKKIGEFFYAKHQSGFDFDTEILEVMKSIDTHNEEILAIENQIKQINEEAKQATAPIACPTNVDVETENSIVCPACGSTKNNDKMKFCCECGTKLEQPAPVPQKTCTCGALIPDNIKFCPECGTKID